LIGSKRETNRWQSAAAYRRVAAQFMSATPTILYCHCAYAQVVPKEVKEAVLKRIGEAGVTFEAVADLCAVSARSDPALRRLAGAGALKIAACYPRAVKWLFAAANAPLRLESAEVLNMCVQSADEVAAALLSAELRPNLPTAKPRPAAVAGVTPAAVGVAQSSIAR
jgi:hypothetical protein